LISQFVVFRLLPLSTCGTLVSSQPCGSAERALFVVDRQGDIRYAHVNPIGEGPDNKPVLDVLRKLV